MKRPAGAYTIIEVMIVLAISGTLLLSAIGLFRGQRGETAFDQAVHDASSEISTRVKEVGSTSLPNGADFGCTLDGSQHAVLSSGGSPPGQGSNDQCVVLGKAFEAAAGSSDIYIYTVLGRRVLPSGDVVQKLSDSNPEPVVAGVGNGVDITEKYSLPNGAKVATSYVKLTSDNSLQKRSLVGYYTNLQGDAAGGQNGSQLLTIKGYNYNNATSHNLNMIQRCLEQSACAAPDDISLWELCLSDPDGRKTAVLDVLSSSSGLSTSLKFTPCS